MDGSLEPRAGREPGASPARPSRPPGLLTRWLVDIRSDERRNALGGFLTLFGMMVGHSLLETARDALFLAHLPAERLPWVYMAIALCALALTRVVADGRESPRGALIVALLAAASGSLTFWMLTAQRPIWTLYGLYIWTGVIITLVTLRFWLLLGDIFTVTQAKRVFGPIGVGGVLGAITGSALAVAITDGLGARALIPVAVGTFSLTALVPLALLRLPATSASAPEMRAIERPASFFEDLALFAAEPHARRIGLLVMVSALALTLVDFVFKATVAEQVAPAELGPFFARFYTALNVLSLLAQLALVSWAVRRMGVTRSLSILAVLLLGGSLGVLLGGGLVAALALKGADGALRHSVHRTALELLYLPFPSETRGRLKSIIDVLGQRGGQAAASLVILVSTLLFARGTGTLSLLVLVLALGWLVLASRIGRTWLDLFRDTLSEAVIRTRLSFPELDLDSFASLVAALNSTDDAEVIAAMDTLAEQRRIRVVPALVLYHPSRAVVLRALKLFVAAGRTDFLPIADRLLRHDDPSVRIAALLARSRLAPREHLLRRALQDASCPGLQSAALVALVAHGWLPPDEALAMLGPLDESEASGRARALGLARALRAHAAPVFADHLHALVASSVREVQRAAVDALASLPSPGAARALVPLLAQRHIRASARDALVAAGDVGLDVLHDALRDTGLPFAIRLHVPRTLCRFVGQRATDILAYRLLDEPDTRVRYKILRALGRLRADRPELYIDPQLLRRAIERTLRNAVRLLAWRHVLVAEAHAHPGYCNEVHTLLVQMLDHTRRSTLERLFRLLGLRDPGEDFHSIYLGLQSTRREVRASSRELLEHALEPPWDAPLIALVDDSVPEAERVDLSAPLLEVAPPSSYEEVLDALLALPSEALRALAVYQVGALRLRRLQPALDEAATGASAMFGALVERARQHLDARNDDDDDPHLAQAAP